MGVSMLPRFAAMVCHVRTGITSRSARASLKMEIAKGTKIMRDTSLVKAMEVKKQMKIKNRERLRLPMRSWKSREKTFVKNSSCRRPAAIAMRQKRSASREKLMVPKRANGSISVKQAVTKARSSAADKSIFCFI